MNHIFDKDYLQSLYCQCVNLCGPRKSGKTTWLNEARGYYSDNGHPVIYMDFSDCRINNYEEFVLYIKKKVSKVYLDVFKCFDKPTVYYQTIEHALKIINGECNEEELRESLQYIVYYYRGRLQQRDKRAMIFIDEISKPLLYAAKYDFLEDVYDFYDDFLDIDHYELSGEILTTSFLPAEVECQFYL